MYASLGRDKQLHAPLPLALTRSVCKLVPLATAILPLNDLTLLLLLFLSLDVAVALLLYDDTFDPIQLVSNSLQVFRLDGRTPLCATVTLSHDYALGETKP